MEKVKSFGKNRSLFLIVSLSALFLVLIISVIIVVEKKRETRQNEMHFEELNRRKLLFYNSCTELKEVLQKAAEAEFIGIQGDNIIFTLTNRTKQDIKFIRFDVIFLDAFGDKLNYDKEMFFYEAIDPANVIKSGETAKLEYDLYSLSKKLPFNIYKYKNHLKATIEINRFSFSYGASFNADWIFNEFIHKHVEFTNGPDESLKLLKSNLLN